VALPLFRRRAGGGPRTPLAVTPPEAPARRVTAADGGLRAASHTGRSRAKPGFSPRGPIDVPRGVSREGAASRPPGPRSGPAAQRSSSRTEGGVSRLRACGAARKGPRPPALRGGQCPSRRVHADARAAPGRPGADAAGAAAEGVSRGVRGARAARPARLAPRTSPTTTTARTRPPRAAAKKGKQLELRRRRRGPRRLVDAETARAPRYQGRRAPGRRRSRTREARGSKSRFLDGRGPGRTGLRGGLRDGPRQGPGGRFAASCARP